MLIVWVVRLIVVSRAVTPRDTKEMDLYYCAGLELSQTSDRAESGSD